MRVTSAATSLSIFDHSRFCMYLRFWRVCLHIYKFCNLLLYHVLLYHFFSGRRPLRLLLFRFFCGEILLWLPSNKEWIIFECLSWFIRQLVHIFILIWCLFSCPSSSSSFELTDNIKVIDLVSWVKIVQTS